MGAAAVLGAKADKSTIVTMASVMKSDDFESVDFW